MADSPSFEELLDSIGTGGLLGANKDKLREQHEANKHKNPRPDIFSAKGVQDRNKRQTELNNLFMDTLESDTTFTRGERAARMNPITADLETAHAQKRSLEHSGMIGKGVGSGSGIAQKAAQTDELNSIMELADAYSRGALDEMQLTEQLQGSVLSSIQSAMETDRSSSSAIRNYNNQLESGKKAQGSSGQALLSGAAQGASLGAPLGPIGAGVGAAIGGITSLFSNKDKKKKIEAAKRNDLRLPILERSWKNEMEKRAAGEDPTSESALNELLMDGRQGIGAKGAQGVQSNMERQMQSQRRIGDKNANSDTQRTTVDAKRRLENNLNVANQMMQPAQQLTAQQALQRDLANLRATEAGVTPVVDMSPSWWQTAAQVGAAGLGIYGQLSGGGGNMQGSIGTGAPVSLGGGPPALGGTTPGQQPGGVTLGSGPPAPMPQPNMDPTRWGAVNIGAGPPIPILVP